MLPFIKPHYTWRLSSFSVLTSPKQHLYLMKLTAFEFAFHSKKLTFEALALRHSL